MTLIAVCLIVILLLVVYFFFVWLCLKLSRKIFSSIERWKGKKIYIQLAESLVKLVIIIVFLVIPLGGDKIGHSLLGSAAVLAAVVGFAAQDVIKNILNMKVTVYYLAKTPTEILKDDINARVFEALGLAGIEIPYPYTRVIMQKIDLEEEKRDLQDESD